MSSFSLIFVSLLSLLSLSVSQTPPPPPRGILIDCGATEASTVNDRQWLPDTGFISSGTSKNLTVSVLDPILSTVRSFPLESNLHRKFCYEVDVFRGARYMVRTTYYYGGVNGNASPPVFDQIVDGTLWSRVNTTGDYARGSATYYEAVFKAQGKTMSLCIAANSYTNSDPFISALEFVLLGNSLYNSTDFDKYGLALVTRNSFGHNATVRFPDDQFDRIWEPFGTPDPHISANKNLSVSGIWNLPPARIFETELSSGVSVPLEFSWPAGQLPDSLYYIALYFADDRNSSSQGGSRLLNASVNGVPYYKNLTLLSQGEVVYSTQWPLSGVTKLTLNSLPGSSLGPLINGGEVFSILTLGGRTLTRDVIALEKLKSSLQNTPLDWNGDPCLPKQYSWTGVKCSEGPRIRVISLNLTSMSLSGSIPSAITRMTALTDIWLGNNSLSGSIPELGGLRMLETLHLEDNQFTGPIPTSLGNITVLRELFLQNNNLSGPIPSNLIGKSSLDLRTSGNPLLSSPPPS